MNKYSVSLVYSNKDESNPNKTSISTALRAYVVDAVSPEEAFGICFEKCHDEHEYLREWPLILKQIIEIDIDWSLNG